jgi:hypothetical protein
MRCRLSVSIFCGSNPRRTFSQRKAPLTKGDIHRFLSSSVVRMLALMRRLQWFNAASSFRLGLKPINAEYHLMDHLMSAEPLRLEFSCLTRTQSPMPNTCGVTISYRWPCSFTTHWYVDISGSRRAAHTTGIRSIALLSALTGSETWLSLRRWGCSPKWVFQRWLLRDLCISQVFQRFLRKFK